MKDFNLKRLKIKCQTILSDLKRLTEEVELLELTNEQWWISFEDKLNFYSTKDHNADQNS